MCACLFAPRSLLAKCKATSGCWCWSTQWSSKENIHVNLKMSAATHFWGTMLAVLVGRLVRLAAARCWWGDRFRAFWLRMLADSWTYSCICRAQSVQKSHLWRQPAREAESDGDGERKRESPVRTTVQRTHFQYVLLERTWQYEQSIFTYLHKLEHHKRTRTEYIITSKVTVLLQLA